MARRHRDWNESLAEDLQDPEVARAFLMAAVEEEFDLQAVLGKVIRVMGVKEFAGKVGMASSNVVRAINPRHNPTLATLNRLLGPFGLRLSLALLPRPKRKARRAA
jgi:DNA-binding phage protein